MLRLWGKDVEFLEGNRMRVSVSGHTAVITRSLSLEMSCLAMDELTNFLLGLVGEPGELPPAFRLPPHVFRSTCVIGSLARADTALVPPSSFDSSLSSLNSSLSSLNSSSLDAALLSPLSLESLPTCATCIVCPMDSKFKMSLEAMYDLMRELLLAARRGDPVPWMDWQHNIPGLDGVFWILSILVWRRLQRALAHRFCALD